MKRPSIKFSFYAIFGLVALVVGIISLVAIRGLMETNRATDEIATHWLPAVKVVNAINTATSDYRIAESLHVLSTDIRKKELAESEMDALSNQIKAAHQVYETLISSDQERQIYEQYQAAWANYKSLHGELLEMSRQNNREDAYILFIGKQREIFNTAAAKMDELVHYNEQGSVATYKSSEVVYEWTRTETFIMVGVVAIILAAATYFVAAGIVAPINKITVSMRDLATGNSDIAIPFADRTDDIGAMAGAVEVFRQAAISNAKLESEAAENRQRAEAKRIADQERTEAEAANMRQATSGLATGLKKLASGDLSFQLTEAFADDFEGLRQDFNTSVIQLAQTLSAVAKSIGSISNGSQEISNGANDLSKRTEQQAAALEETAAALDEITVNVANSSKRSEEARQVATEANASATRSEQVVGKAVEAMNRIEGSSVEISNIIGVIDEIAFQTNLLALNAGVEAARAGEAGKGFAVVAQEVRELAQRSAQAAKEIKGLIQTSSSVVSEGVQLVTETGAALKSIGEIIERINHHMEAIATSAREQSTGLGEVNIAVNQMDQTTQQNAAMVEESSAAASTLADEADNLRQLISQFNLGNSAVQSAFLRQTAAAMDKTAGTGHSQTSGLKVVVGGGSAAQEWAEF